MRGILPQANDLDKVIDVMTYIHYHPGCSYDEIADYSYDKLIKKILEIEE